MSNFSVNFVLEFADDIGLGSREGVINDHDLAVITPLVKFH